MKKSYETTVAIGLFILVFLFWSFYVIKTNIDLKQEIRLLMEDMVSYELYNPENKNKLGSTGVYFSNRDYYCVSTKDRDWEDIKMTDYHEMCHAFVNMDWGHFCNSSKQIRRDIENYID